MTGSRPLNNIIILLSHSNDTQTVGHDVFSVCECLLRVLDLDHIDAEASGPDDPDGVFLSAEATDLDSEVQDG